MNNNNHLKEAGAKEALSKFESETIEEGGTNTNSTTRV
jgi:hypothetical protein